MADQDLKYRIGADDKDARRVLDSFAKKLEETDKKTQKTNVLGSVRDAAQEAAAAIPVEGVSRIASAFSATGPIAAFALVLGGVALAAKSAIGAIDDLDEAAQGLGTTAVALSELRIGARNAGVDFGQLEKALGILNTRAAEAFAGNSEAAAAFSRFGIDVRDAGNNLKPTEQLLAELSDSVKKFANDAQRSQGLVDIFGQKLGPRLSAYLAQGSDSLRVASGLTQQMVDDANKAQREIDKLGASWDRLKIAIGGAAAAALNALNDNKVGAITPEGYIKGVADALRQAEAQLDRARTRRTNGPTLFEQVFGDSPEQEYQRAQEAVDKLRAILANVGTARFTAGRSAILATEFPPESLPGKEDLALLGRNQQALAAYVQTLQTAIDAGQELSNVQKVTRALSTNAFGNLTADSKQARDLLLQLAAAADRVQLDKELRQQTEAFAAFVNQLESTITATQNLTAVERTEAFIAQNPRAVRTEQQKEAVRFLAVEVDKRRELVALLQAQTREDEQTASTGEAQRQRVQALDEEILGLAGVAEQMRKIRLTGRLEELLASGAQFSPEQLDRIVKGIAGLSDATEEATTLAQDLGAAGINAFRAFSQGGTEGSQILRRLASDLSNIAIDEALTKPLQRFLRSLDESRGALSFWDAIFGALRGFGAGGTTTAPNSGPQLDGGLPNNLGGDGLVGGASASKPVAAQASSITLVQHNTFQGDQSDAQKRAFADQIQAKTTAAIQNARVRNPSYAN